MANNQVFQKFSVQDIDVYDKMEYNLLQMAENAPNPKTALLFNTVLQQLRLVKDVSDQMVKLQTK